MTYWWYTDWFNPAAYAGWSQAGDARDTHPPSPAGSVPVGDRDRRLLWAVTDALFDDPAVTGGHIDLSVQNGVVILDGHVDTEQARAATVARAWSVNGVTDVCDALTVPKRRRRAR